RAAAVFALGNRAFERRVIEGVIFRAHGESLDAGVAAWAIRHGPAFENAVQLQPEIVVQTPGIVLLDEVRMAGCCAGRAGWLGGAREVPLAAICLKRLAKQGGGVIPPWHDARSCRRSRRTCAAPACADRTCRPSRSSS